jgi:hypothetical protein
MSESVVYFIQGVGGAIKIGTTRNLFSRLSSMQTGSVYQLTLVGVIAGDGETEKRLHRELAAYRHSGEWFTHSKTLMAVIDRELSERGVDLHTLQGKTQTAREAWAGKNSRVLKHLEYRRAIYKKRIAAAREQAMARAA